MCGLSESYSGGQLKLPRSGLTWLRPTVPKVESENLTKFLENLTKFKKKKKNSQNCRLSFTVQLDVTSMERTRYVCTSCLQKR